MDHTQELSYDNVTKAAYFLEDKVEKTPVYQCPRISQILNDAVSKRCDSDDTDVPKLELYLKCENLQTINSKFRGATYFINLLANEVLRRGVVGYSTGNHALSLASACKRASLEKGFSIPVIIIVPGGASSTQIEQIGSYGAKVIRFGSSMSECLEVAQNIQRRAGMVLVPPSGHPHYVLGQGTVALEFLEQVREEVDQQEDWNSSLSDTSSADAMSDIDRPALDVMVVPSAGSGLLAGAAVACQNTGVKVIAAEPSSSFDRSSASTGSAYDNHNAPGLTSLARDLHSVVAEHDWDCIKKSNSVHGIYNAGEHDIAAALKSFLEESQMTIEPSGAVALATLLCNSELHDKIARMATYHRGGRLRIGVVISGGSITLDEVVPMFAAGRAGVMSTVSSSSDSTLVHPQPTMIPTLPSRPLFKIPFGAKGPLLPRTSFIPAMAKKRERRQLCAKF